MLGINILALRKCDSKTCLLYWTWAAQVWQIPVCRGHLCNPPPHRLRGKGHPGSSAPPWPCSFQHQEHGPVCPLWPISLCLMNGQVQPVTSPFECSTPLQLPQDLNNSCGKLLPPPHPSRSSSLCFPTPASRLDPSCSSGSGLLKSQSLLGSSAVVQLALPQRYHMCCCFGSWTLKLDP